MSDSRLHDERQGELTQVHYGRTGRYGPATPAAPDPAALLAAATDRFRAATRARDAAAASLLQLQRQYVVSPTPEGGAVVRRAHLALEDANRAVAESAAAVEAFASRALMTSQDPSDEERRRRGWQRHYDAVERLRQAQERNREP